MIRIAIGIAAAIVLAAGVNAARAQTNYESWAPLVNPFESTGGGGVMIDGYKPVVSGEGAARVCTTDFTVKVPNEPLVTSEIVFDAVAVQGGILCTKGKWRTKDGGAEGTTPFEVFIKDGVMKRSP
ncbi:MAG: hypothetical protein ACRCWF_11395 [Beijerinckiaceae bacterium]